MKKLLGVVLFFLLAVPAFADELNLKEDIVDKIPEVKTGVAYSLSDSKWQFMAVFPIYTLNKFSVNTGYVGAQDPGVHKAVVSVDYEVFNPESVTVGNKIVDAIINSINIRPSVWFGAGRISNLGDLDDSETEYGLGVTILEARFY